MRDRRMRIATVSIGLCLLWAAGAAAQPIALATRAELAPTGALRVGINYGNVILASQDPASGTLRGVHVDLARELGRLAGVPVQLVGYAAAAPMVDALVGGTLDVALMSAEPARAGDITFSPAYVNIEATYLVPAGSPIRTVADVDREGTRVAVAARSAYDFFLQRTLTRARLERAPSTHAAFELFTANRLDALVGLRPRLVEDAATVPGSRILEGAFMTIEQTIASPKGRAAAARYLRDFVAEATLLDAHAVRGVSMAAQTPRDPRN